MTAIVGILCRDGVVIGADSATTFTAGQNHTIEQKSKKIQIIENRIIVAGTGSVGLGQRFCGHVQNQYTQHLFQKNHLTVGVTLSRETINDFIETKVKTSQYGALLACPIKNRFYLCEFSVLDFQPEWKDESLWFVSMGCGQTITDPFLGLMRRVFWGDSMPNVADAIFVTNWTLQQAIQLNPGGINGPPQIAVLKLEGGQCTASLLTDAELQEHNNNVYEAERYLSRYKDLLLGDNGNSIPIPSIK